MPKNKKPSPFMAFALEYKNKYKINSLQSAISKAGDIWKNMPENDKSKYKTLSLKRDINLNKPVEKLTSQGIPIKFIEKEQYDKDLAKRLMKKEIQDIVKNSQKNDCFSDQKYYFVMGNYFYNSGNEVYIPAEIALSEFSLKYGICSKYHTLVDPQADSFGFTREAQEHSANTHKLPLPPNALGEKDYSTIYFEILNFIGTKKTNDTYSNPSPIFTHVDNVLIVSSILRFFYQEASNLNENLPAFRVYPMDYLFYHLKMTSADIGEVPAPPSMFVTNALLDRDIYEYQAKISCDFHEEHDRTKYCALSCVVRWGFIFASNICMDLAITAIPGQHCPQPNEIACTTDRTLRTFDDDNYYSQPEIKYSKQIEEQHVYKPEPYSTSSGYENTNDNFPSLGRLGKKPKREF